MINLVFGILLIFGIVWAAKKFYFPTEIAEHQDRYPIKQETKISKRELAMLLSHLQRWKKEGKLTREEYDHLTDLCLGEMRDFPKGES